MESHSESRSGENAGERAPEVDSLLARAGARPPSTEVRASLAAVQAARAAAELRLQRDSLRIRVLTMAVLAMVAAGTFALAGHLRARRRAAAEARAAAAAHAAAVSDRPAVPAAAFALTVDSSGDSRTVSSGTPSLSSTGAAPAVGVAAIDVAAPSAQDDLATVTPAESGARDAALAACREAYDRHRWRSAVEACASAFEVAPRDAGVAMKVAQAQHARAHYADAGDWARRALALEDADPDAYVILAHAERRAGHPAAVRNAYHQYLLLAPRGWHAAEARAALRGSRASARPAIRRSPIPSPVGGRGLGSLSVRSPPPLAVGRSASVPIPSPRPRGEG